MMLHKSLTICSADVKCEPLLWAHLERSSLPAELVQSPLISTHWRPGQHRHIAVTWVRTHSQQHIIQIERAYWYDNVFNMISPPRRITNFELWIQLTYSPGEAGLKMQQVIGFLYSCFTRWFPWSLPLASTFHSASTPVCLIIIITLKLRGFKRRNVKLKSIQMASVHKMHVYNAWESGLPAYSLQYTHLITSY